MVHNTETAGTSRWQKWLVTYTGKAWREASSDRSYLIWGIKYISIKNRLLWIQSGRQWNYWFDYFIISDKLHTPRLQWDDSFLSYKTQHWRWNTLSLHGNVSPHICDSLIHLRWRCNYINLKGRARLMLWPTRSLVTLEVSTVISVLTTLENERDLNSVKQRTKELRSESLSHTLNAGWL